ILMPYPTPTRYLVHEPQQRYTDLDEKKRFLQAAFAERLRTIRESEEYQPGLPTVLIAHVNVQGSQAERLFHLSPDEAVVCPADLPTLGERYSDHERALVRLDIRYTAGTDQLEAILHELDAVFPRWYDRVWVETGSLGPAISAGPTAAGFEEVVREYLAAELA